MEWLAAQPDGANNISDKPISEVVTDKGYHSNQKLVGIFRNSAFAHISRNPNEGKETGRTRLRSVTPFTPTGAGFAESEANVCCANAG